MSDEHRSEGLVTPHGVDGWVRPRQTERELLPCSAPAAPLAIPGSSDHPAPLSCAEAQRWLEEIGRGKALAILSHGSILFGLPLFLIPLFLRDNRFALHHAKAAGINFAFFAFLAVLTFLSCGIFLPAMLLCYIPALVGVVLAASGQLAGPFAFGELGERFFERFEAQPPQD